MDHFLIDFIVAWVSTQIADHISNKASISFGVPQGSVLGPLLFLLYVEDIHQCSTKLKFYLFADDTNILFAEKNLEVIETVVNTKLCKLYNWLTFNKLTLNISKSNFVIFHPKQKKPNYKPKICLFDNEKNEYATLESKEYIKYLGILIDKNLTWRHHIDTVSLKINKNGWLTCEIASFCTPANSSKNLSITYLSVYYIWTCCLGPNSRHISIKFYCYKKELFR